MLTKTAAISLLNDMLNALEGNCSDARADAAAAMIHLAFAELRNAWPADELAPYHTRLIERLNRIAPLPIR